MDKIEKEIIEHKKQFEEIVKKYNFAEESRAHELATFLTKPRDNEKLSSEEFSTLFGMSEKEAVVFLSFIQKGLEFKKELNKRE
jgi:hypothetical protein